MSWLDSLSIDSVNNILSYLSTTEYRYVNSEFNKIAKSLERSAAKTIYKFLKNAIAEKNTIKDMLKLNSNNNVNLTVYRKYIIKCYNHKIKQRALTFYISNINRSASALGKVSQDVEKMLIFTTFMLNADINTKLYNIFRLLLNSSDPTTKLCIYDMYRDFVKYSILYE